MLATNFYIELIFTKCTVKYITKHNAVHQSTSPYLGQN